MTILGPLNFFSVHKDLQMKSGSLLVFYNVNLNQIEIC